MWYGYHTFHMISRKRVSVTINPALLKQVDAFVDEHPGVDRSKVFDEALACWYAARQEQAMVEQYSQKADEEETNQIEAWRGIQRAAAARLLRMP